MPTTWKFAGISPSGAVRAVMPARPGASTELNVMVDAWRGSLYPYKYDLRRFVGLGTVTIDHPDPSIFTVITSPSDPLLGTNFDVMAITPGRCVVADRSFRPPGASR